MLGTDDPVAIGLFGIYYSVPGETEVNIYYLTSEDVYNLEGALVQYLIPGSDAGSELVNWGGNVIVEGAEAVAEKVLEGYPAPIGMILDEIEKTNRKTIGRFYNLLHNFNYAHAERQGEGLVIQPVTVVTVGPLAGPPLSFWNSHEVRYAIFLISPDGSVSRVLLVTAAYYQNMDRVLEATVGE